MDWVQKQIRYLVLCSLVIIFALALTLVVMVQFIRLNGAVISPAILEISDHTQSIQHMHGGKIKTVNIRNGQMVEAGQVLLTLDAQEAENEYQIYNQLYIELIAEKSRLLAERDGQSELTPISDPIMGLPSAIEALNSQKALMDANGTTQASEIAIEREKIQQIEKEIQGIHAELEALELRESMMKKEAKRQEDLRKQKLIDQETILSFEQSYAQLVGQIGRVKAEVAVRIQKKAEIELVILQAERKIRDEAQERLRKIEPQMVEIFHRRQNLKKTLAEMEVRAPISGQVFGVQIYRPETVVEPGRELLQIVPQEAPVVLRGRIQTDDRRHIYLGQKTEIRFSAMSFREHPALFGRLVNMGADAELDEQSGARFYTVEIAPSEETTKQIQTWAMGPGQAATLYLRTEARSLASYLLDPVYKNLANAFREP